MSDLSVVLKSILCSLFALTAPFMVPFALLFTKRDALDLAWSWYDTPDEPDLIDLDGVHQAREIYEKWGWFIGAWYWFGIRNRGHGFESLFSKPAKRHWDDVEGLLQNEDGFFLKRTRWGNLLFVFGWQVYASKKYPTGLEYRPKLTVKYRAVK
jgi:hypothetical protein